MKFRFPIVIIDEDFRSENTSGLGIRALAAAIEKEGMEVLGVTSYGDLSQFAQQQSRAVGLHPVDRRRGVHAAAPSSTRRCSTCASSSRRSASRTPRSRSTSTARRAPRSTSRTTSCASCTASSTCSRTRRSSSRATSSARRKRYLDGAGAAVLPRAGRLRAGRLVLLALPRPLGRRRVPEEPGRARCSTSSSARTCCAPTSATRSTSSASCSTTPARSPRAERNAARIFNADHCFFVTNGTSTSNKMVWHTTVAPGDIVVVDRNCHKSILHAIIMTGAIPVFLTPTRNHSASSARSRSSEFTPESIAAQDRRQPVARGRRRDERQAAHPDAHAEHLRRRALQRRDDQARRSTATSTPCTSTRPGCRTRPSTTSTAHARDGQGPPARRRSRWSSRPSRRTSCWPASVAGVAGAGAGLAERASSTGTSSTRPT